MTATREQLQHYAELGIKRDWTGLKVRRYTPVDYRVIRRYIKRELTK